MRLRLDMVAAGGQLGPRGYRDSLKMTWGLCGYSERRCKAERKTESNEMDWNFDMSEAPRGHETMVRGIKGREYARHVPERIIAASATCDTVTITNWLPGKNGKPGRWNMFRQGEQPLAWMPFPKHPGGKGY